MACKHCKHSRPAFYKGEEGEPAEVPIGTYCLAYGGCCLVTEHDPRQRKCGRFET